MFQRIAIKIVCFSYSIVKLCSQLQRVNAKSTDNNPIDENENKYVIPILKNALLGNFSKSTYLANIVTKTAIDTIRNNLIDLFAYREMLMI